MPRKKVLKKPIKQKQKVKVTQNVKVVVGDVKRKQVRKSNAKPTSKPPMVLNISNPQQPYNNMFMEYFKKQLQNQQPIQANTLKEHEKNNEREESIASRAGTLGSLDQEPDDVARELRRQRVAGIERFQVAQAQQRGEVQQIRSSLKPLQKDDPRMTATPLRPRRQTAREHLMTAIRTNVPETPPTMDREMLQQLQQRQNSLERAINQGGQEEEEEEPAFEQGGAGENPPALERKPSKRGRKASDLYTPQANDTRTSLLDKLSEMTEAELDKKLTGVKLKAYMHQLGLPNRERGSTNPLPAQSQRIAIMGLIQNYKRDKRMDK